jgi:hypothetical protein
MTDLNAPMPCGHPARYSYPPDGDTHYCLVCELEADHQPPVYLPPWRVLLLSGLNHLRTIRPPSGLCPLQLYYYLPRLELAAITPEFSAPRLRAARLS